MTIEAYLTELSQFPILPIITVDAAGQWRDSVDRLVEAGVVAVEILLRTPEAVAALAETAARHPRLRLAAGTVLDAAQVDAAIAAGAHFGISPGLTDALASAVKVKRFPFLPGVQSASEVMRAREIGFSALKYYPAAQTNGGAVLDDFRHVFPTTRFVPTGKITLANLADFARLPNIAAVGGSFLHAAAGRESIAERVDAALQIFRTSRVG